MAMQSLMSCFGCLKPRSKTFTFVYGDSSTTCTFPPLPSVWDLQKTISKGLGLPSDKRVFGIRLRPYVTVVPVFMWDRCFKKAKSGATFDVTVGKLVRDPSPVPTVASLSIIPSDVTVVSWVELTHAVRIRDQKVECTDEASLARIGRRMMKGIRKYGFFRLAMPQRDAKLVEKVYKDASDFFEQDKYTKNRTRKDWERMKFTGYCDQGPRQFMQLRRFRKTDSHGNNVPPALVHTETDERMLDSMKEVWALLGASSRLVLAALLCALWGPLLSSDHVPQSTWLEYCNYILDVFDLEKGRVLHEKRWATPESDSESGASVTPTSSPAEEEEEVSASDHEPPKRGIRNLESTSEDSGSEILATSGHAPKLKVRDTVREGAHDSVSVCTDVMRLYQYYRPADAAEPGLDNPATGLHVDLGLITVSPPGGVPGLLAITPDGRYWIDAESEVPPTHFSVFTGETMGRLSNGRVPGVIHYVLETFMGVKRFSNPYFLRGKPGSVLPRYDPAENPETVAYYLEKEVFVQRPWSGARTSQGQDY